VHHSAEHLDWLAAHRKHPLDPIYTVGLIKLPAFLLGFDLATLAGFTAFRGIWAIYIHSNVRLPLGPPRMTIGAPELHHWHHAKERYAGNYANLSPLMDILFGTCRHPGSEPPELGIAGPFPKTYLGLLMHPLAPKRHRSGPDGNPGSDGSIVHPRQAGADFSGKLRIAIGRLGALIDM
jgi:sterol desaturase/sphingolipid hydroxylase (fatty acid hydroxylase superfamily)